MTSTITLHLGSLGLEQAALRTVYGAIARLSSHEPGLLSSIAFDGSTLRLMGVADNGEQVFAKLGNYLGNLPLQRQLESLFVAGVHPSSYRLSERQGRADQDATETRLVDGTKGAKRLMRQEEVA